LNSSDFVRIHDIALAETLEPGFQYYYRSICRWYSEHFHTALHAVHQLSPAFVLQNYYEATMANIEEEDLDALIFKALNPDTDQDSEEEIQDFIKMVEAEDKKKRGTQSSSQDKPSDTPVVRTYNDELPEDSEGDTGLDALDSLKPPNEPLDRE
jgi:hypothetical protein